MNSYLESDKPIIYADMNIYRYLACEDISIFQPERFIWVYSHVHLDEICRSGNTDALDGMRLLNALEISEILDENFQSTGRIVVRTLVDPLERFEQHKEAIAGYEEITDHMVEQIIRSFGADNFEELSKTPDRMSEEIDRIISRLDAEQQQSIKSRVTDVATRMKVSIDERMRERMPIDSTRSAFGITSEARKSIEKSSSPIDEIWELISPKLPTVSKDRFFGFEPSPEAEGIPHTQHGAMASAHLVLNMVGITPDKGLAKREKIKNILSDGQHIGMASYCNAFVSADRGIINKARCIYSYLHNVTNPLHFEFTKGSELNLSVQT